MTKAVSKTPNLFELVAASGFENAGLPHHGASVCDDEGGTGVISDARLKADIEQVGKTVHGLTLYQFRYLAGKERFEGVMAQDVLEVMPEAVLVGSDGFYRVNYSKLGIAMRPL